MNFAPSFLQLVHVPKIASLLALAEGTACPLQAQLQFSLYLFQWCRVATGNTESSTVSEEKVKQNSA